MSAFTSPTFLNEYYLTTCNFDDIQGRAGQEFSVKFQPYSNKGLWIDGAIFSRGANIASQSQRNAIKTNWVDIAPGDAIFMKPAIMYVNRINLQFQKILQSVVGFFYQDLPGSKVQVNLIGGNLKVIESHTFEDKGYAGFIIPDVYIWEVQILSAHKTQVQSNKLLIDDISFGNKKLPNP